MENGSLYKCQDSTHDPDDYFQFLPVFAGSLKQDHQELKYSGQCFQDVTFDLEYLPNAENPTSVKVHINAKNKRSLLCREHIFISTATRHHIEPLFLARKHVIEFKNLDQDDFDDIKFEGLRMYFFCHGIHDEFISIFNTLKLFVGGLGDNPKYPVIGSHVPAYMEKANVQFLSEALDWNLQERKTQKVWLTEEEIHDGDFLAIFRLDGLDEIIMWGTGGTAGHSAVVLTLDGEKHVVESQDAWYWPKHKIQRNTWKDWVHYADNCDFHVAVLPLRQEYRDKFNLTAAQEWFKYMEGYPYGYHNFLFSWIDTPDQNFPHLLAPDLFPIVVEMADHLAHPVINSFFIEAMNQRLGTSGLSFDEVLVESEHRNMTLQQLMAMPEQDEWIYSDGPSMVCSCFVIGVYKAAGLFGDMEIQANEFTPKDVYQLDVYDVNAKRPEQCVRADPDSPFCQILGKYKMEFPGYSTIKPYSHMNEHCPSEEPLYVRPDGC